MKIRDTLFSENYCLRIMTVLYIILAVFSVASGILTHSTALVLDGSLSIFDVISILATLAVAKVITSPPSSSYHFGYFKLESLLVSVQAFIMMGTCVISALHAIKDVYHQTSFIKNFGWGFSYIIFSLVISSIVYFYCLFSYKKHPSPLLNLQVINWRYSIFLAIGLFVGFIIAYMLEKSSIAYLNNLAIYVDPLMTCIVIALIMRQLFSLFSENLNDLLDKPPKYHSHIEDAITSIAKKCAYSLNLDIQIKYFKIRRAGRAHFCTLGYTTDHTVSFHEIILLHNSIETTVQKRFTHYYITLMPNA